MLQSEELLEKALNKTRVAVSELLLENFDIRACLNFKHTLSNVQKITPSFQRLLLVSLCVKKIYE